MQERIICYTNTFKDKVGKSKKYRCILEIVASIVPFHFLHCNFCRTLVVGSFLEIIKFKKLLCVRGIAIDYIKKYVLDGISYCDQVIRPPWPLGCLVDTSPGSSLHTHAHNTHLPYWHAENKICSSFSTTETLYHSLVFDWRHGIRTDSNKA